MSSSRGSASTSSSSSPPSSAIGVPAAAIPVLAERGLRPDDLVEQGKFGLPRAITRLVASDVGVVLEVATDDVGQLGIRREVHGRKWAREHGVPTAALHAVDPDGGWLVGEWLPGDTLAGPAAGEEYVTAAMAVAERIAAATPPTDGPPYAQWRSSRLTAPLRILRGFRSGIPTRLWWTVRRAVAALPRVPVAHNDFYHRNVLWRPTGDSPEARICVVDWEYLGEGPRYGDAVRLWVVLPERETRDALLTRLFASTPTEHHGEIALLALWLAIRLIGENVKTPKRYHNAADTQHAWTMLAEATELAREHGVYPR